MNKWRYIVWVGGTDDYYVTFEDAQRAYDEWIDKGYDDVLIVHKMFELYLMNTEIDYTKDDFNANLTFSNPAAKSSCGCGTSFSI